MDIVEHLTSIELPTENVELVVEFLSQNEADIKDYISKKWNNFSLNNAAVIIETDSISVIDNSSNNLNNVSVIMNLEDENKPMENPLISSNEINSTNVNLLSNTGEIKDIHFVENENINTNSEPAASIVIEPDPTQLENKASDAFANQIKNKLINLPNGKAGQAYKFIFNFEALGLNDIAEFWFEGLEQIGLAYNTEAKEIQGIPLIAGDHKITLKIKRIDWSEGKPIFERIIMLVINPDPKTLWKNIPTPFDIEYYKPDSDKCFVKVEASNGILGIRKKAKKDIVAASQRGRSHAQEGKARDDDFALGHFKETDWYILIVADGAGSAKSSRKGSQIACNTVLEACESLIKNKHKEFEHLIKEFSSDKTGEKRKKMGDSLYGILGSAVFKAVKNIDEEAKLMNKPIKDFSTTLIVSICKKFNFGWFVGAFWVGDGGIGIYNKETQFLKVLGESDSGEFAGQTRFLTMPEITQPSELYRRLRFDIVDDFTALILMTDGITDPKFETDSNLMKIEKWNDLWNDLSKDVEFKDDNVEAADQLLKWLDFWSPGNHDDRTIAILY